MNAPGKAQAKRTGEATSCTWPSSSRRRTGSYRWVTGHATRAAIRRRQETRWRCSGASPRRKRAAGLPRRRACIAVMRRGDGFWLRYWLIEQGIDNVMVDSSGVEVDHRAG